MYRTKMMLIIYAIVNAEKMTAVYLGFHTLDVEMARLCNNKL